MSLWSPLVPGGNRPRIPPPLLLRTVAAPCVLRRSQSPPPRIRAVTLPVMRERTTKTTTTTTHPRIFSKRPTTRLLGTEPRATPAVKTISSLRMTGGLVTDADTGDDRQSNKIGAVGTCGGTTLKVTQVLRIRARHGHRM